MRNEAQGGRLLIWGHRAGRLYKSLCSFGEESSISDWKGWKGEPKSKGWRFSAKAGYLVVFCLFLLSGNPRYKSPIICFRRGCFEPFFPWSLLFSLPGHPYSSQSVLPFDSSSQLSWKVYRVTWVTTEDCVTWARLVGQVGRPVFQYHSTVGVWWILHCRASLGFPT